MSMKEVSYVWERWLQRNTDLPLDVSEDMEGNSFAAIERRAHSLVCPACGTCALEITLRCDFGDRQYLAVATCTNCLGRFDAETLPTYEELHEKVLSRVRTEACPACGSRQRTLQSSCDRIAQLCWFLISCSECGDVRTC